MARRKPSTNTSPARRRAGSLDYSALVEAVAQIHVTAQGRAAQAVNVSLTLRNRLIGCHIVEYEQNGRDRAQYGERLLDELARDLRRRLGRGFGRRNLFTFRQLYLCYPIVQSVIAQFGFMAPYASSVPFQPLDWQDDAYFARLFRELPWTHFIELIRMDDPLRRAFYEVETVRNRWSARELKRQIASRQRRVTFDNEHYWIDLLLYNRRLKCLVAIDLVLGPFRHEYAGAMNFYLNYLKAEELEKGEAEPVGIVLCLEKNETHVEYALGGITNQVFVSRYLANIPTKEELQAFLKRSQGRLPG
jgi:hypothetical protein